MPLSRRSLLGGVFPGLVSLLGGCGSQGEQTPPPPGSFTEKLASARQRGVRFLLARQSAEGAWKSDVYGTFKDGTALTPLALQALLAAAPDQEKPVQRAAGWLAAMARPDGSLQTPAYGLDFAIYTSALSVTTLSHPRCPGHGGARDTWLKHLRQRQLTEDLGWQPGDREYGGWGYARGIPRKPRSGEIIPPLTESNLSATTVALEALTAAGVPAADPAFARARAFVERCQNWTDDDAGRDPAHDDGGFFFIYEDPVRNKAGVAGKDRHGRTRFHSYGSTTADGLRCLIACGAGAEDPRRRSASGWLLEHFHPRRHPGKYAERHEPDRMAVYFYYLASLARTPLVTSPVPTDGGPVPLGEVLAVELLRRQRPDGSWSNPAHAIREDDPIVATSLALLALAAAVPPR